MNPVDKRIAEIETELKARGFFDGGHWHEEAVEYLLALVKAQREALEDARNWIGGGILNRGEKVRQVDGSIRWELIRTGDGILYDKLCSVLSFNPDQEEAK